jgi:crotonobetainyl-CoA:carnitine CoA-transferase CaiB-like acyl-CoA transferase
MEHGAPCLGQHNEYVYGDILGLTKQEIVTLAEDGVI